MHAGCSIFYTHLHERGRSGHRNHGTCSTVISVFRPAMLCQCKVHQQGQHCIHAVGYVPHCAAQPLMRAPARCPCIGASDQMPHLKCSTRPVTFIAEISMYIPVAIRGLLINYSMTSGSLPPGLQLDFGNGAIGGIFDPTEGTLLASHRITITWRRHPSDTLTIIPVYSPLSVAYPTLAACDAGSSVVINPVVFSIPSALIFAMQSAAPQLPSGLTFDPTTGALHAPKPSPALTPL